MAIQSVAQWSVLSEESRSETRVPGQPFSATPSIRISATQARDAARWHARTPAPFRWRPHSLAKAHAVPTLRMPDALESCDKTARGCGFDVRSGTECSGVVGGFVKRSANEQITGTVPNSRAWQRRHRVRIQENLQFRYVGEPPGADRGGGRRDRWFFRKSVVMARRSLVPGGPYRRHNRHQRLVRNLNFFRSAARIVSAA